MKKKEERARETETEGKKEVCYRRMSALAITLRFQINCIKIGHTEER